MKSGVRGKHTSDVEVTNISAAGFWLLLGGREVFLSFTTFPWFRAAAVGHILHVEWPSANHLYWPELDIDLAVESIEHPERYPLVSAALPNKPSQRPVRSSRAMRAQGARPTPPR